MNNKGYTLIEVITTVSILLIIIGPVTLVFDTWYKNFYIDNSSVLLDQKSRDIMDSILTDLRMDSNETSTSQDDNKTLFINDSLKYEFNSLENKLLRNGESVLNNTNIQVIDFNVKEEKPEGYDTNIIKIYIKLKSDYDVEVELESTFRKKYIN
ncbi:MAG: prepilin-type N-terminal cleavage/methylation domain-containing protein [Clostridiales bacterium]